MRLCRHSYSLNTPTSPARARFNIPRSTSTRLFVWPAPPLGATRKYIYSLVVCDVVLYVGAIADERGSIIFFEGASLLIKIIG